MLDPHWLIGRLRIDARCASGEQLAVAEQRRSGSVAIVKQTLSRVAPWQISAESSGSRTVSLWRASE